MTERREAPAPLEEAPERYAGSVAQRLAFYQRAGGLVTPLITAFLAFLAGGIVVVATTGHNPLTTYKAIFEGSGLNWFFRFGSYHIDIPFTNQHVWFWWNTSDADNSAYNLIQTLAEVGPLILTALAVAFAFRCGLFNIGGQGQYLVGAIVGVWVGTSWAGVGSALHVLLAVVLASLAGAAWAAIAGLLKATVGAHEVITTIMLNWIAYWAGSYAFGRGGPLQEPTGQNPISAQIYPNAQLPTFWGEGQEGVHIGFFVALAMLVVFAIILNRTTLGYQIRAVGYNPDAARYGGIGVARSYILAMAISGLFAGLAGVLEILGRQYSLGVADVQVSTIGFIGIAVALLGRNTAVGIGLAAVLFGALDTGTSTRVLDPKVFDPTLADNLAVMIQALVLLFVGADLLVLYLWQARRKLRLVRAHT